jgi:hypothetical protein
MQMKQRRLMMTVPCSSERKKIIETLTLDGLCIWQGFKELQGEMKLVLSHGCYYEYARA